MRRFVLSGAARQVAILSVMVLALVIAGVTTMTLAGNARRDRVQPVAAPRTVTHTIGPPSRTAPCLWAGYTVDDRTFGWPTSARVISVLAGQHDCYDRIVFTFDGTASGYRIRYVDRVTGVDGRPLRVRGTSLLDVTLLNGTAVPAWGGDGVGFGVVDPAGYAVLRDVVYGGTSDGQSTYGVGLNSRLPLRVFWASDHTLVVDIAHVG